MTNLIPKIAVTSGEPAGIGPDICLDLVKLPLSIHPIVLGDITLLQKRVEILHKKIELRLFKPGLLPKENTLDVVSVPLGNSVKTGQLDVKNAPYVLSLLDTAYEGIVSGKFIGMVTAPIHKGIINEMGMHFTGHTEYLADISNTKQVVMMLEGGELKVALVTTHLPLRDVANKITPKLLISVINIINADLKNKFGIANPRILVAGLNPHAGENGFLGTEEINIIEPTLAKLQQQGKNVLGPFPADTIFQSFMLEKADVILTMYHDQGLPVLKYASFGKGVNITLGLPFIRTSVDHGTALDLAATGKADSGSLLEAVQCAYIMSKNSKKNRFNCEESLL